MWETHGRLNGHLPPKARNRGRSRQKEAIEKILAPADVRVNGQRPWDIRVHDDGFYQRVLAQGSMGLGESYMDGWWDCDRLDDYFCRILYHDVESRLRTNVFIIFEALRARLLNLQSKKRAFQIGQHHYDLDNELYELMLDSRMAYSCGYWKDAASLDEAQEGKLDLICRKLGLEPGMKVLDIGCGWGSFIKYAAEKYGVQTVGVTVSREQAALARESCRGLPVEVRLQDYREVDEKFDHIVSVGMFEHVGLKNYRTFMEVAHNCLKDDGLFLLHTIGRNRSRAYMDPWMSRYIFPNSLLPSIKQISQAIEGLFVMEDWHNFSTDYDRTLMSWHENFVQNWHALSHRYDKRFYRMWRYYLMVSAGAFRSRTNQLWQIVLSKKGVPGGYESVR